MEERLKEVEKLCIPLVQFLRKNYDPHTEIIVSTDFVKVSQELLGVPVPYEEEYN